MEKKQIMDSAIGTSMTKAEHALRSTYSNAFSTKLSLPKLISVTKLLTPAQKHMVQSIGFHHLLDIRCESVPRGICLWLVKHFDVESRSLDLPNGSKFTVTSHSIHQVLGIPNGGTAVGKKCDNSLKKLIADETGCKGKTPTINELKSLFTADLIGDKFKRVFTLFAIGSFLCPTSYDCISSDYYSAVEFPDQISSHDWCSAVLEKLIHSIEFYQKSMTSTSTTTLGGCVLALVIIYFEMLDIPNHSNQVVVPRLKFWSTDMIKAFETLDAKDDECVFGKLPLKKNLDPISSIEGTTSKVTNGSTKMPSKCISGSCTFKANFTSLSQDMANEIINAIGPVLSHYCDRMHAMWHCHPEAHSQHSVVVEQGVQFDRGKSIFEAKMVAADIVDKMSDHLGSSTVVKEMERVLVKSEPSAIHSSPSEACDDQGRKGDCIVTHEQSVPHDVQGLNAQNTDINENKVILEFEENASQRPMPKGHNSAATSSFLQVPSFSQHSSNTCSYDASTLPAVSDSSSMQKDTTEVRPRISLNAESMGRVFGTYNCTRTTASSSVAAAIEQNADSTEPVDDPQPADVRTPERDNHTEFDFWGHGLDSDFEVKSPSQIDLSAKHDPTVSNSSSRKRSRSLNEVALDLYASRRLIHGSAAAKCTQQSTLNAHNVANEGSTEGARPMQSTSVEEIQELDRIEQLYQSQCSRPFKHHVNFTSTLVEKEVFRDIIDRIPFSGPRPRVVEIKKNWVDHKTFGLSMRVYGAVSSYVIDLMGKAVMTEEYEKNKSDLLPDGYWYRHVIQNEKAKLLQRQDANAQDLTKLFRAPNQGYRLDTMDLIFIPLFYDQFWYLVVANFRTGRFEVLLPNQLFEVVKTDSETVILNFKRMFNDACPNSRKVHVWAMQTVFRSETTSKNHCDSGVFIMKLIKSHDGESQHHFKPEDAKTLRECLTYYLLTHPSNDKYDSLVNTKKILSIHGVNRISYS